MLIVILVLHHFPVFSQAQEQPFHKVLSISCNRIHELHQDQWIINLPSFWSHIWHFLERWRFRLVIPDPLAYTWLLFSTLHSLLLWPIGGAEISFLNKVASSGSVGSFMELLSLLSLLYTRLILTACFDSIAVSFCCVIWYWYQLLTWSCYMICK